MQQDLRRRFQQVLHAKTYRRRHKTDAADAEALLSGYRDAQLLSTTGAEQMMDLVAALDPDYGGVQSCRAWSASLRFRTQEFAG